MSRIIVISNADDLVNRYLSGESINQLSKIFGISRSVAARILTENGIELRNQSEAEKVKWDRMTAGQRERQVDAAHKATKGKEKTFEVLCKAAIAREKKPSNIGKDEIRLKRMLETRGHIVIGQKAVGPYNIDLGVVASETTVAVEVFGGWWHWYGKHAAIIDKRFRYLLNRGWYIIVVNSTDRHPITENTADYISDLINSISRNPPTFCKYWVIRGAGELIAGGSVNDDQISIKPTFTSGRNSKGQYCAVPR
ncbi:hypothetical protein LCGC14_2625110 [marine sediment metagenome]|uniref:DUF559 domain-containing protein n=1 Tax=marine sediment metagenome TaxID=412755 RepID=A0A0F9CUE2_9ZZZZ